VTIDELRTEMLAGFANNGDRFATIDDRFATIDDRFKKVDDEFAKVRAEITMSAETIRAEIKREGETTRRHFDIMVEKISDSVKIVAEATAHNSSRLDDHDARLKRLERPRRR
jgi:archaellum component FlaC